MRYRVEHVTRYSYDADVTGSFGQFHLTPRELGWQRVESHEVSVEPVPTTLLAHTDLYGNTKSSFHVTDPHTELVVRAVTVLDVVAPVLTPEALAVPWEEARPAVRTEEPDAWEASDFTFASPYVDVPAAVEDYARVSFTPGRALGEAATELMHRVHDDFAYRPRSTVIGEKVADLLVKRHGVCQDFSHVMVAAFRSLGLAGRYVSGYLATRPPPGRPRLVGADASHAWVGVWVPGAGWLHLDPTNDRLTDASHATVAWGRDYGDVPPVRGVIFTEAKHSSMKVSVDMAPG